MKRFVFVALLALALSGCSTCLSCLCQTLVGGERQPGPGQAFAQELRPTRAAASEAAPAPAPPTPAR